MPIIGGGGSGSGSGSAGSEISYTQITAPVSIASSTEATGTAIISPAAATFDGSPVIVTFNCVLVCSTLATTHRFTLFEGATEIGRIAEFDTTTAGQFVGMICGSYRFTPTLGSHTYTLTAHVNNTGGTQAQVLCGTGGTGAYLPAFLRFTKV